MDADAGIMIMHQNRQVALFQLLLPMIFAAAAMRLVYNTGMATTRTVVVLTIKKAAIFY